MVRKRDAFHSNCLTMEVFSYVILILSAAACSNAQIRLPGVCSGVVPQDLSNLDRKNASDELWQEVFVIPRINQPVDSCAVRKYRLIDNNTRAVSERTSIGPYNNILTKICVESPINNSFTTYSVKCGDCCACGEEAMHYISVAFFPGEYAVVLIDDQREKYCYWTGFIVFADRTKKNDAEFMCRVKNTLLTRTPFTLEDFDEILC